MPGTAEYSMLFPIDSPFQMWIFHWDFYPNLGEIGYLRLLLMYVWFATLSSVESRGLCLKHPWSPWEKSGNTPTDGFKELNMWCCWSLFSARGFKLGSRIGHVWHTWIHMVQHVRHDTHMHLHVIMSCICGLCECRALTTYIWIYNLIFTWSKKHLL
jgi:hypothetical protein